MDPRTYVALEHRFFRKLQKEWRRRSASLTLAIAAESEAGRYDAARKLVQDLDMTDLGTEIQEYVRATLRSFVIFGSSSVSDYPGVLLMPETENFITQTVMNFQLYLEHAGTTWARDELLQLIARQEAEQPVQKAERKVKNFVSFAEAEEGVLQLISSLHSNRLATWGFVAEAEVSNVSRYRLNAILDGRTSKFCRLIHGKEFSISDAKTKIMQVLAVQNPDDLKTVQPWPKQNALNLELISKMDEQQLVSAGLHIPPFHPACRTLLALVSRLSRLEKPVVAPDDQKLPPTISSMQTFKELGLDMTEAQVDHWNAYVGVNPVQWLEKFSGTDPLKILEGVFGKSAIKILPDGDVLTKIKGMYGGSKFSLESTLDPYTGKLYLSKADFVRGDLGSEARFLRQTLFSLIDEGLTIGSSALAVPVGEAAYQYAKLGFVPGSAQWQQIRVDLIERLTEGDLSKVLSSLDGEKQDLLLNLLTNKDPQALGVLMDLPWEYRGRYIGQILMEGVDGVFEIDLTNKAAVAKTKEYLS